MTNEEIEEMSEKKKKLRIEYHTAFDGTHNEYRQWLETELIRTREELENVKKQLAKELEDHIDLH